jgi:C1A family cysteine protease
MTLGPFADMSAATFANRYLIEMPPADESLPPGPAPSGLASEADKNIDYRTSPKLVTSVKNQGSCGSCWAFSAAGAIEGAMAMAGHGLTDASPQELVDCSTADSGCSGGLPSRALKMVVAKGFAKEKEYRYQGTDYMKCKKSIYGNKGKIHGPYKAKKSIAGLYSALKDHGPVSVAIDASSLQHYHSGVISSGGTRMNHAVLLVGQKSNAWIIKNSWGTGWGESAQLTRIPPR